MLLLGALLCCGHAIGSSRAVRAATAPRGRLVWCGPRPIAQLFDDLAAFGGVESAVALQGVQGSAGLVAREPVSRGGTLLRVPRKLLITCHRSGVVGGLVGQTDGMHTAAGDLRAEVGQARFEAGETWDVRLALGVMEATAGAGGSFWDGYRQLLPLPPHVASAACLPVGFIPMLSDAELEKRAHDTRAKLRRLHPSLHALSSHPATAFYEQTFGSEAVGYIPSPLDWCHALVISRVFTTSDPDTFAFTPFLDMANHAARPTANFTTDADGAMRLYALTDLASGDEVAISYDGGGYSSRRFFELYGFCPRDGSPCDDEMLLPSGARQEERRPADERMLSALASQAGIDGATPERVAAISAACARASAAGEAASVEGGAAVLARVREALARFDTSLEDDMREVIGLEASAASSGVRADPRLKAVLAYRVAVKRLLLLAEQLLE
jgi:hypothetical protein